MTARLSFPVGYRFPGSTWTVIAGEPGLQGPSLYFPVRCDCGRENWARGSQLKDGKTKKCRSCRGRQMTAATAESGHIDGLHRSVWPKVCRTCETPFVGTARQQYCRVKCRPSARRGD